MRLSYCVPMTHLESHVQCNAIHIIRELSICLCAFLIRRCRCVIRFASLRFASSTSCPHVYSSAYAYGWSVDLQLTVPLDGSEERTHNTTHKQKIGFEEEERGRERSIQTYVSMCVSPVRLISSLGVLLQI